MLKKTISYVDYDGNTRTEDFYFNLTKAEITSMYASVSGGLDKQLKKVIDAQDMPKLMELFRTILQLSYGEKSDDGRRFVKSPEIFENFSQTEAYSEIFMELCTDSDAAAKFIDAILPADMAAAVAEERKKQESNIVAMPLPQST